MDPPPPEGTIVKSETKTVKTEDDGSVVTTTKTVYVTTVPIDDNSETAANTLQRLCSGESEDIKDIDFLKPTAVRRSFIDREAYLRLHHINGNRKSIDSLKVKYEQAPNADKITDSADTPSQAEKTVEHVDDLQAKLKLSDATIESLKSKYSPSSFGYPKSEEATSPLKRTPPATPKRSVSLKSPQKPEVPAKPESLQKNFRHSYIPFSSQPRPVVAKRSSLIVARAPRIPDKPTDIYENLPFESRVQSPPVPRLRNSTIEKLAVDEEDEEEERIIIRRAPSEDCMLKIQADLEDFTMDGKQKPKDKKRTSSFRNILTGGLFKKDGKKKSDKNPDKVKTKKTENGIVADNAQNEHRNSQNEHTLLQRQNSSGRGDNVQYNRHPMQRQNSIGRGDHYEQTNRNIQRQNSIGRGDNYDHVNRPVQSQIQRQNSIGKADMERRYAEMYINEFNKKKAMFGTEGQRHIQDDGRKGADMESSSSSNTLESEGRGTYQNALLAQAEMMYLRKLELETMGESPTPNTDTPPRLKETQMITSKASIPINSRRALPNPYQQRDDTTDANLNIAEKVEYVKSPNYDFDPYGTKQSNGRGSCSPNVTKSSNSSNVTPSSPTISARSSPRSPTLEGSKLRLPTNREKVNLQPRLKSPIPQPKISTDKIIATELLKKSDKKLDKQAPTHQKLEIEIDYPDSYQQTNHAPSSQMSPPLEGGRYHQPPREFATMPSSQKSQASPVEGGRYHQPQREVASLPISQKSQASPIEGGRYHQPQREVASPPTSQKSQASPVEAGRYHQPQREVASPPTSQKSQASPIEAGRYQQQREMVKSPSLVGLEAKQVTTDATVHKESSPIERNSEMYGSLPVRGRPLPQDIRQRSVTPVRRIPSNASLQYSPSKQEMRQSVEMYCWKEIQKLKEKQDQELNYQLQYTPYGYVEDPIIQRRSRSTEPTQHRGRRSTSLPREVRPSQADRSNRYNHPLAIPENRPVYYGENDIYGQRNPNFVRSSPQRRTVSTISRGYEGYYANTGEVPYRPIFNRGSLNPQSQLDPQYQSQKKNVSFNGNAQPVAQWPTRNGYVASPPQRRLEKNMSVESDDVFLPNVPPNRANDARMRQMNEQMQRQIMKDPIYGSRAEVDGRMRMEEPPYGTRRQIEESYIIRRQIIEDPYGNRQVYQQTLKDSNPSLRSQEILNEPIYAVKENKHNSHEVSRQKQENLQNIYGSKHDPELYKVQPMNPMYASKISVQESPYGTREPIYGTRPPNGQHESPYGYRTGPPTLPPALSPNDIYGQNPKQITVSNKVCDMYGRIHDNGQKVPVSPPYGPVQQSGVIYGQLQGNGVTGRPPLHHSYNQLPNSFVRGSRLTSSANDMYRRPPHDPRYHHPPGFNPNAPLPPTPAESKTHVLMRRRGHPTISDTESETSEVRTIMNRNYIDNSQASL